jgi:hypothetical protein
VSAAVAAATGATATGGGMPWWAWPYPPPRRFVLGIAAVPGVGGGVLFRAVMAASSPPRLRARGGLLVAPPEASVGPAC